MNEIQKIMIAILGVFIVGFVMVGENKTQTIQEREAAAMVRAITAMQGMAHKKCPALIKKHTGSQVSSLVSNTDTDRATYYLLEWNGEKNDNFKKASCTLSSSLGGISKLVIDGKVLIDKKSNTN